MFPPKPDGQTDIHIDKHTYRRTDISVYKVASLLKTFNSILKFLEELSFEKLGVLKILYGPKTTNYAI